MKNLTVITIVCLAASFGALAQERPRNHVEVTAIEPRVEDVATIDGIIRAYYEVVSGPKGQPRQWSRDRTLYIGELRFVQVDLDKDGKPAPRVMSHQEYVDRSDPSLRGGFFETEIHRVSERFGPIAHVWSTYESRAAKDGPLIARGINAIELFWDGKRWWIANAIWSEEAPGQQIPRQYLPAGN